MVPIELFLEKRTVWAVWLPETPYWPAGINDCWYVGEQPPTDVAERNGGIVLGPFSAMMPKPPTDYVAMNYVAAYNHDGSPVLLCGFRP
jgi:hypothetical protein